MDNNHNISPQILSRFNIFRKLGEGSFGTVYLAENKQTNLTQALKIINLDTHINRQKCPQTKQLKLRMLETQGQTMMKCNSKNILKCYQSTKYQKYHLFVLEYCSGGSLYDKIQRENKIEQVEAVCIMSQLLNGFQELHSKNIIHRDLKTQNILIHNGVYKIADFGVAKQLEQLTTRSRNTVVGSRCIMAPQVTKYQKYDIQADMWSLGVIYYEMLTGELPFRNVLSKKQYQELDKRLDEQSFSSQSKKFFRRVFVEEPSERLSWNQLYEMKNSKCGIFKLIQNFEILEDQKNIENDYYYQTQPKNQQFVEQKFQLIKDSQQQRLKIQAILLQNTKLYDQKYRNDSKQIQISNQKLEKINDNILKQCWQNGKPTFEIATDPKLLKQFLLLITSQCIKIISKHSQYLDFNQGKPGEYSSFHHVNESIKKLNKIAASIYQIQNQCYKTFEKKHQGIKDLFFQNGFRKLVRHRTLEQKFDSYLLYTCKQDQHIAKTIEIAEKIFNKSNFVQSLMWKTKVPKQLQFMRKQYKNIVLSTPFNRLKTK